MAVPITDDEIVLRHVPGGTTWQAPGPRITSRNFYLRPGETGVSVSRRGWTSAVELMTRLGNPVGGSRIAEASVSHIRDLGLDVAPVPLPDDPGHAEIRSSAGTSLGDKQVRTRLAQLFRFIDLGSADPV